MSMSAEERQQREPGQEVHRASHSRRDKKISSLSIRVEKKRLRSSALVSAGAIVGGLSFEAILEFVFIFWMESALGDWWAWIVRFLVLLVVAAVLLFWGIRIFKKTEKEISDSGTLYYARLLFPWMQDTHQEDLVRIAPEYQDQRIVAGWITAPVRESTLDVAAEVDRLGQSLAATMNEDDVATNFVLAPNLLFPLALSLGYDFYRRKTITLYELQGKELDHQWKFGDAEFTQTTPILVMTESETRSGGPVVVSLDVTGSESDPLQCRRKDADYSLKFAGNPVKITEAGPLTQPAVVAMAHLLIRKAIHENPGELVLLKGRMPKTTAFALGWLLANDSTLDPKTRRTVPGCGERGCQNQGCLRPWSVLVPLYYERTESRYQVWRVNQAQPPISEIMDRLKRGSCPES